MKALFTIPTFLAVLIICVRQDFPIWVSLGAAWGIMDFVGIWFTSISAGVSKARQTYYELKEK